MSFNSLPFPINESVVQGSAPTGCNLDHLLGQVYETPDGKRWRLVELDSAGATFDVRGKIFKYADRATFKVVGCSATADQVAGVGYIDMIESAVADTNYLLIQISGRCVVIQGDDVTGDPGAIDGTNKFVTPGDDADLGKAEGTATRDAEVFAEYVSGTAVDDAEITVDIIGILG